MHYHVDVPIAIFYKGSPKDNTFRPVKLLWEGREYKVTHFGLHHKQTIGKTLFHVFSFDTDTLSFRVIFNTDTLETRLELITDGEVG